MLLGAVLVPIAASHPAPARADVTTNSNDPLRDGWYPDQTALTPATVTSPTFGRLFDAAVDGQVYAQPIVSQGTLLVATEDDNVYGLDPLTGAPRWERTFGVPFNASDIGCPDLAPHIGITGTPVVDPATNIAYFLDKQYVSGTSGASEYLAQAIDVATGTDEPGWPIVIQGYADNAPHIASHLFSPRTILQRPGLLLMDGVVYAAFGSSCDLTPYNGWVIGLSTTTHSITTMWSDERDDVSGGGIWQAGSGLMSDGDGQILLSTGNGGWDLTGPRPGNQPPNDLAEAVARLVVQPNGTLNPFDFFAPYDGPALEDNDLDFGSGGPVGLPDAYFGTASHPHLLVMEGKEGYVYLLDRDNLGGYLQGPGGGDGAVDRIGPNGGVWSRSAVWPGDGGYVYQVTANGAGGQTSGASGFLRAYKYGVDGNGNPALSLAASSSDTFGYGSGAPVVTSNGVESGSSLLWVIWEPDGSGANAQLRAYDPVPVDGEFKLLWSGAIGTAAKFTTPTVNDSHVYVATRDGHVMSFWSPVSAALTAPPPTFNPTAVGDSSNATVTFTARQPTQVTAFSSTDPQFTLAASTPPTPVSLATGDTISVPITFTPTSVGLKSTTLHADTTGGPVDIAATAVAASPTALLVASPAQLSLGGTTPGGSPLSGTVILTNAGAVPLNVGDTDLPGEPGEGGDSPFTLSGLPAPGTQIAAGASIDIDVTFAPAADAESKEYDEEFTVHSDGGDQTVDLTAVVATSADVSITPLSIDLGDVPLGTLAESTFTLHNSGGLSATFVRSKPPAKLVGFYAFTPLAEGTPLPAGGTLTEIVRFVATKLGTFSDSWSLNPADGLGVRNVTFTAHVVENGGLPQPADSAWKLNGTAKRVTAPTAGALQLTAPTATAVAGSAFYSKSVPSRYLHVAFDATIGGGSGADGLAFVLADAAHATPSALGAVGGGLGFAGIPGVAFALDTNQNAGDPAANFVGVSDGPNAPGATLLHWVATSAAIPALEQVNASPPTVRRTTHVDIQIGGGFANVIVGGVVALSDVPVALPPQVLVGFTGANGGRTDDHTVTNVKVSLVGPATTLTAAPPATINTANATFAFTASVAGSTFRCSLDNAVARPCPSPYTVTVAPGQHKLSIQAVDPTGIAEARPLLARWAYALPTLHHGYWMLGADGTVYGFGDAHTYGHPNDATAIHLTPTHTARGYWIVNRAGRVYAFGDAPALGSAPALAAGEQATSISATNTDRGYWIFTSAGRVFAFGDARAYGDLRGVHLNGSVIDSVPTASGHGYYMIAADGGVFAFGDARFHGSLGATRLNQPIIGLVPTPTGKGYWLDASDGGVFAFGDAPFRGSLGSVRLNRPIVGMVAFGNGYLLGASDGGVFDYSSSPFLGSLADHAPSAPIVGLAAFGQ